MFLTVRMEGGVSHATMKISSLSLFDYVLLNLFSRLKKYRRYIGNQLSKKLNMDETSNGDSKGD